jgi:hypothetical protein
MFYPWLVRPAHGHALCSPASVVTTLMLLLASMAVQAQVVKGSTRADPQDSSASVPALVYVSSLHAAKPPSAEPAPSWRQANDTVTGIGGWRVYALQAQQPEAPAAATDSRHQHSHPDSAQPKHQGHGHHRSMHPGQGGHARP